jgi:hypothetical protein
MLLSSFPLQASRRALAAFMLPLALAACPKAPTQTASMEAAPNVDVSADQLQMQVYAQGQRLSGMIAVAADSIERATADPRVRRRALEWKLAATPLVQEASLRDDPLVAAVDLAALSRQQYAYFATGDGRSAFGALQPVAVNSSRAMEHDMTGLLRRSSKEDDLSPRADSTLNAWVELHPITGTEMQRQSVLGADWRLLGVSNTSLASQVVSMNRTIRGMTLRLGYINETLSSQLRWNAQLLTLEALESPRGDSLFGASNKALRSAGDLAATMPDLIAHERGAVMAGIDRERVLAMSDVDRQRVETLHALTTERLAIEAAIQREREAVMSGITAERIAAFKTADSVAQRTIGRTESMVTRLLWEGVIATVLIIVAGAAAAVYVVKAKREA